MTIVIVRYNAGNVLSVRLALKRLGYAATVSDDPDLIRSADKLIFPGQGEAASAMAYLQKRGLDQALRQRENPTLGICLGLQLMADNSEENDARGLGLIPGTIRRFPAEGKVPHMGWNRIYDLKGPLFRDIPDGSYVYFVHSYYMEPNAYTSARCEYLRPFSAAVQKANFHAVQFHPEKSAEWGAKILENFMGL